MTVTELLKNLETETNENLKAIAIDTKAHKIVTYSRSDINMAIYYGWENRQIAFWGVSGDRVILYLE